MDTLKAAIESCRNRPGDLYASVYLYFQALFHRSKSDVSKIQLISYLPQEVYGDRTVLGSVITGAVMAMFNHRVKNTGDWSRVPAGEIPVYVAIMPPEHIERLDEIIVEQAKTVGAGLLASDLVMVRVLEWERNNYSRTKQWLRALDKATRIHQRMTPPPLTDPFLREVKQRALEELRPAVARLKNKFHTQRRSASARDIVKAFEREASSPDLPWLSDSHNLSLWLDFCRSDPFSFLNLSASELFDRFAGFVSQHESQYTRQKISSRT